MEGGQVLRLFPAPGRIRFGSCHKAKETQPFLIVGYTMNRHSRIVTIALLISLAGFVPLTAPAVSAHEHVTIGEYELTIGWRDEPSVAGVLNGLDLGIVQHFASNNTTYPVVGVETNLRARLSMGLLGINRTLAPQFGRPGWYTFDVIPTRPGTYRVRITGTLNTTAIDAAVNLDDVSPASELSFPVADPTATELQNQLAQASAALQSQLIIAIAAGVVGILMALAALAVSARASRSQRKAP
jgi:hypothetical protein